MAVLRKLKKLKALMQPGVAFQDPISLIAERHDRTPYST